MAEDNKRFGLTIVIGSLLAVGFAVLMSRTNFSAQIGAAAEPTTLPAGAPAATTQPGSAADEQAIRATATDFVKAFNAADAKAVAALWAMDAMYTDETGRPFQGRDAIEKLYADMFKNHPGATMTVNIESVRFLGPDIAVEKGIAQVKSPSQEVGTGARYTVVHARRDGKWTMVVVRDSPYVPGSDEDYLKDLAWLIGEWKTEAREPALRVKFEWMAKKNFIKNTYSTEKDGQEMLTGGQIIGWNPLLGQIVSWHFDPQGGFGNDVWTRNGSKWVIRAAGVFRDGSVSSAVNVVTPIDANSFTWQSVERTLDGVKLPDSPVVKIVRVTQGK